MLLPPKPKLPDPISKLEKLLAQRPYSQVPISVIPHCEAVPLGVMVRGTLEWLFDEESLLRLFKDHAPEQYTRELTLTALVNLVIQVSAGTRGSVHAAYKADQAALNPTITTTFQAVYGKLGRINPTAAEAIVRFSAEKLGSSLAEMPPVESEPVPGYRLRILDGNVLTGTDHRLKILRPLLNACLPGKSLVVYEAAQGLVTDLVLCEDAYAAERTVLVNILPRVQPNDLWLADRNFCTPRFVFGVASQGAVLVRQHRTSLLCHPESKLKKCGQTETGVVYEQRVYTIDQESGKRLSLRRIELRLFDATRDGDRTLALLTNLPDTVTAAEIAEIYRKRWTIENHFQFITESLNCEIPGLGKPRAALFMFAMSLVAGNVLATMRGSIRAAHGREVEAELSGYYFTDELAAEYRALMKYYPAGEQWTGWARLSPRDFARLLIEIAKHINLKELTRSHRGPKKPPAIKPVYNKKHKHFSTGRLQQEAQAEDSC
jgi:IS4 transposase